MVEPLPASYIVGGVRLPRPFRIRRLGHFGINVNDPEVSRLFYERLLGLRVSDRLDLSPRFTPEERAQVGPLIGYFTRHGTEHHSFVFFPRRALAANYKYPNEFPEVTVNQITWQVGSLREVVDGFDYFKRLGLRIHRSGRDLPGSNWNVYPFDPDGHVNELFYGIEQIGWQGLSKPLAMHDTRHTQPPPLPFRSEYSEVQAGVAKGVDPESGWRQSEPLEERHDVGGVLLGRPFKIVRVGPVRIFVRDVEACLPFYRDTLGLMVTEEVVWKGHRCVYLRANTEHHSIALYPVGLRAELGLHAGTTVFSLGMQLGDYQQLRDAIGFLRGEGVTVRYLPPELFPGIGHCAFAIDPDGHAVQLYHAMEQVGWDGRPRPAASRRPIDNDHWPDVIDADTDTFLGEAYLGPWN
ncbi:MAG: VOC family protein [Burkholderiales bacterium]|nr:VOC family protein [Burkholderiales bacterium]